MPSIISLYVTITEKWNIQQIEKADAISILKHLFLGNLPNIKIIPDILSGIIFMYNTFPKTKNHQVMMK